MDHPYVLSTYTITRSPKEVLMIIEYCEGGDLLHDVKKNGKKIVIKEHILNNKL
jgi:hypothetical protein